METLETITKKIGIIQSSFNFSSADGVNSNFVTLEACKRPRRTWGQEERDF